MSRTLIRSRLTDKLDNISTHTCTIQSFTTVKNAIKEDIKSWVDLTDHVDLKCFKGYAGGGEMERGDRTLKVKTNRINLLGNYPLIKKSYHAIVDSVTYNILTVDIDPSKTLTGLSVEVAEV